MIQEINPMTLKEIKARMRGVLKGVGDEFGVDINIEKSIYTSTDFRSKVVVKVRDNGSGKSADQLQWEKHCVPYGAKKEWFGKTFKDFDGDTLKIVGWNKKASKNKIHLEDEQGKRFVAPVEYVEMLLEKVSK